MAAEWDSLMEFLHKQRAVNLNPTIDSLFDVALVLDEISRARPTDRSERDAKLNDLAARLMRTSARNSGKFAVEALLKKAKRLDSFLSATNRATTFYDAIKFWRDEHITTAAWSQKLSSLTPLIHHLLEIRNSFQQLVRPDAVWDAIRIETTRHLNIRFWPKILARFEREIDSLGSEFKNIRADITTREPYSISASAIRSDATDISLTYGDTSSDFANQWDADDLTSRAVDLHRCILLPGNEPLPAYENYTDLLKRYRVAILSDAERNSTAFKWPSIKEFCRDVCHRRSHVELHSFVRGQCGAAFSYVEFLDDGDERDIQYIELPQGADSTTMICASRRDGGDGNSTIPEAKKRAKNILLSLVHQEMDRYKSNYDLSRNLTSQLQQFPHSYSTASFRSNSGKSEIYGRRGQLQLRVSPGLRVTGFLTQFSASNYPEQSLAERAQFKLFGNIHLSPAGQPAQLTVRATDRDGREVSMASFVLDSFSDRAAIVNAIDNKCIIGHWLGRHDHHVNGGVWVWHQDSDLSKVKLEALISRFSKLQPLEFWPSKLNKSNGLRDLHGETP